MLTNEQRFKRIASLQGNPENIRNISIIAHVDHGKTTLSDSLISSNNIISKKLVGKLRFLDSRKDEQERCITMKSSSISLVYEAEKDKKEYLVNLIDSPGHFGFSSEVSSALRLTDGALLLVDVIEGVSAQTITVLRQSYEEKIQSILVLNKIDRLITELNMTPMEAYRHLSIIIEKINAILSSFISTDSSVVEASPKQDTQTDSAANQLIDEEYLEHLENKLYFAPNKGNIIFCSAIDCWGFRINDFSEIFAKKLGCNQKVMEKTLWGDYYLYPKTKQIYTKPINDKHRPMFVDFILQNVWNVYEKVQSGDDEKIDKIAKGLEIDIPPKMKENMQKDPQPLIWFLMNKWLPLEKAVLKAVIEILPSPREAQKDRLATICKKFYKKRKNSKIEEGHENEHNELALLRDAVEKCKNTEDDPIVIYVSKMVSTTKEHINERGLNEYLSDDKSKFYGFARVFSGVLKRGSEIFVITPHVKKNRGMGASNFDKEEALTVSKIKIENVYVMMAQQLEGIAKIPAGNVCGIGNLEKTVFKQATLSSSPVCPSFTSLNLLARAILKVSLRTVMLEDYPKLIEGLKKLNKADPSIEVYAQENGDIILATCGEVHLERCMNDLLDLTKVKIQVSEPLVPFKETITFSNIQYEMAALLSLKKKEFSKDKRGRNDDEEEDEPEKKDFGEDAEIIDVMKEKLQEENEFNEFWSIKQNVYKKEQQVYQEKQEVKKIDKKNKGKFLSKANKTRLLNVKEKRNYIDVLTANQKFMIRLRAVSLNFEFALWLERNTQVIRKMFADVARIKSEAEIEEFLNQFDSKLKEFNLEKPLVELINKNLVSFGPNNCGPNLLMIKWISPEESLIEGLRRQVGSYKLNPAGAPGEKMAAEKNNKESPSKKEKENEGEEEEEKMGEKEKSDLKGSKPREGPLNAESYIRSKSELLETYYKLNADQLVRAIATGFELSVASGPLCEEPMMGVCFIVEAFEEVKAVVEEPSKKSEEQQNKDLQKQNEELQRQNEETQKQNEEAQRQNEEAQKQNEEAQRQSEEEAPQKQIEAVPKQIEESTEKQNEASEKQNEAPQKQSEDALKPKEELPASEEMAKKGEQAPVLTENKAKEDASGQPAFKDTYGPISGQIMSAMKEACLESFLGANPRIVEGMYLCYLQTDSTYYGKCYGILNKRRASILEETLNENSNLYTIKCHIPLIESFGLYMEVLGNTSGRVHSQLVFDTWKILNVDPFYVPTTEEEKEEHGEKIFLDNMAKQLLDKIRKRKGLLREEMLVKGAEKQSTLSRKK